MFIITCKFSKAIRCEMKQIAIIGSTGSIGLNTLQVLRAHPTKFRVVCLAVRSRVKELYKQALEFKPKLVCVYEHESANWLSQQLKGSGVRVVSGESGLLEASTHPEVAQVIFSLVGGVGLKPIFAAVESGKNVAIANKEPLVMAGELLMKRVKEKKVHLLPIDSEHSGLWQCLEGKPKETVRKLIVTSSGGPFFGKKRSFKNITPEEALRHPRWKMGPKITIDSATLMNKGLEIIEASNLFDIPVERIDVVIHPEAIIHALVEFVDGSHLAQLGITDMRLPIQYALGYPVRLVNSLPKLELTQCSAMRFFKPDRRRFPCLELGYEARREGGSMPAVLNAANEVVVQKFLNKQFNFTKIPAVISRVMQNHKTKQNPTLKEILEADQWARLEAEALC